MKRAWLSAVLSALLAAPGAAQQGELGVNLSWWTNYHPEWVFVDAFKGAAEWVPQRVVGGPWNTGEPIAQRPDGYPAWLAPGQAVCTLMFKDIRGRYPGGRYIVLWDGDGDLELLDDARPVAVERNRIDIDVTPRDGIRLRIIRTNPNDPVHNIRVIPAGFLSTYETQPFHPQFLANWRGFKLLRFMDWMRTGEPIAEWSERPTPDYYSQATSRGVAVEYMILLANLLDADAWFCLPHLASEDYARQLGRTVAQGLEPGRRVYLEYSNECWNNAFVQARWCRDEGMRRQLSSNPFEAQLRFYSQRAIELMRVAHAELAPTHQVIRVLAAQNAGPWTGVAIMDWRDAWREAEALAVAPYFGDELGDPATQHQVAQWPTERVFAECWVDLERTFVATAEHARNARARGLTLIGYEGGQHLVGWGGAQDNQTLTDLFIAANRHPAMFFLYMAYLNRWEAVGGGPIAAYYSTGAPSKWGSWGALEWAAQDPLTAPKYLALWLWNVGYRIPL
ncbi:MAG TPA: hypothetical protein VK081_08230 [Planctomycetota bacterium]|nr:hypothetical protein [Planctomycetota bacterium]